jgi:hypothetical protein
MKKILIGLTIIIVITFIYFITKPADQKSYSIIRSKYDNLISENFKNVDLFLQSSNELILFCTEFEIRYPTSEKLTEVQEVKSKTNDLINIQIPFFINSDVISLQREALKINDTILFLSSLDSMLKKIDYYSTIIPLNNCRDSVISLKEKILFYKQYDKFINSIKEDLNEKCRSYVKNMLTTVEKFPIYNNKIEPIFERDSIVYNIDNNVIFRFYTCKVKKLEPGILNSWNPKIGEYKVLTKTTIYFSSDRKISSLRSSDTEFQSKLSIYN